MKEYPEMMNVAEAAEYLRCSEQQLRKQIHYGHIPAFKLGNAWRISKTALIQLANTTQPQGKQKGS